eukprot:CAMPEP_0180197916 /NCGR_PEP_ID=MMETSP0987-20121128/4887_1 /TAXON_ID=697907 /ORGANISM="non described non described, Strain CCMP2293" /LENGTH=403 /DNA_ID=CAMNT_0022152879 /DNA_START=78 /DNA_END=1289 /DNA_ORIENTATION=-
MMLAHNLNLVDPHKKIHKFTSCTSFGSLHSLAEDSEVSGHGSDALGSPEGTGWLHDSGFNSLPGSPAQPQQYRTSSNSGASSTRSSSERERPKILSDFMNEKSRVGDGAGGGSSVSLISRDCVALGSLLFQDEFGKVYAATWIGVKTRVRVISLSEQGISSQHFYRKISHPIRHPFVESHLGCIASMDASNEVWAMSEAVTHQLLVLAPTLRSLFEARKMQALMVQWALEMCRALCFLHASNPLVVIGDLKPDDILIDSDMHVKVAGVGLKIALRQDKRGYVPTTASSLDSPYLAPEFALDAASAAHSPASDMFSLGQILMFMAKYGRLPERVLPPSGEESPAPHPLRRSRHGSSSAREEVLALAESCISLDPASRPSAANAISLLEAAKEQGKTGGASCCVM